MTALTSRLKSGLLKTVSGITGRHAVLLPAESVDEASTLSVSAPYRVDGACLRVDLLESEPGIVSVALLAYEGHFPRRLIWQSEQERYLGPSALTLDLDSGALRLADRGLDRIAVPLPTRRFCLQFRYVGDDGARRSRLTSHYLAMSGRTTDRAYFEGDNYVDHEAQNADDRAQVIQLLRKFGGRGPIVEVGCATGGQLEALDKAGMTSVGLDFSEWAVARANERLGTQRAWVCDVESEAIPEDVVRRGPFGALVLWAVFEHFREPFRVLEKLTPLAAPGALLLINTTNADSLTHLLFGPQWEGYFDWTHMGVDSVSVKTLRTELPAAGWRIDMLTTHLAWDVSADPTHATIRDWWVADARFRRLLVEREAGDLITCAAVKQ